MFYADYAEIQFFTHFYAIKSITQYSGGGPPLQSTSPPEYCVLRNDGQFLRKVWILNLLRNINFYAIKITRFTQMLWAGGVVARIMVRTMLLRDGNAEFFLSSGGSFG